jgi:hypothetical protein
MWTETNRRRRTESCRPDADVLSPADQEREQPIQSDAVDAEIQLQTISQYAEIDGVERRGNIKCQQNSGTLIVDVLHNVIVYSKQRSFS